MRKYYPTLLIALMYPLSVLGAFISWPNKTQNWILDSPHPMLIAWNVKFATDQLLWVIFALAAVAYGETPNKVNRTSMRVFLLWCVFDTFCYFYNYKSFGYFAMYFWLPVAWLLLYNWESKIANKLWQILDFKK